MAKKQPTITTVSYVTLQDGREVVFGSSDETEFPLHPFTPAERKAISRRLAVEFYNEFYRGRAEFFHEDAEEEAKRK